MHTPVLVQEPPCKLAQTACQTTTVSAVGRGRKRWIPAVPVKGQLWLDAGAQRAVLDRSRSLFSAGILQVAGAFSAQDAVSLCTAEGAEFARGLCNYAHDEVDRIKASAIEPHGGMCVQGVEVMDLRSWI